MARRLLNDAGETLIEVLVAVAILGFGVAGIMPALGNSLSLADRYKKQTKADQVLNRVIEAIQNTTYVCGGTTSYDGVIAPIATSSAYTVGVTRMQYWQTSASGDAFVTSGCPAATLPSGLATPPLLYTQRVSVEVRSPDNRGLRNAEIVKRSS